MADTQPSLFDASGPPPTRRQVVNRQRDEAMRRVEAQAEAQRRGFQEAASRFVVGYLETHGPTSGEALTEACKAAGTAPHDDRAFGPVYARLIKSGAIEKVGTARRMRGHNTAGGSIYAREDSQ